MNIKIIKEAIMYKISVFICGIVLFMSACAGIDPNEANIVDSKDFMSAKIDSASGNYIVDVYFYDYPDLLGFWLYMDTTNTSGTNMKIGCFRTSFSIYDAANNVIYTGNPSISNTDNKYSISFPVSALGLSSGTTVSYWYFFMSGDGTENDRMPDLPDNKQFTVP